MVAARQQTATAGSRPGPPNPTKWAQKRLTLLQLAEKPGSVSKVHAVSSTSANAPFSCMAQATSPAAGVLGGCYPSMPHIGQRQMHFHLTYFPTAMKSASITPGLFRVQFDPRSTKSQSVASVKADGLHCCSVWCVSRSSNVPIRLLQAEVCGRERACPSSSSSC